MARVALKKRLLSAIDRNLGPLATVFAAVTVLSVILAPALLARAGYTDENALQPASAETVFPTRSSTLTVLRDQARGSDETPLGFTRSTLQRWGLHYSVLNASVPRSSFRAIPNLVATQGVLARIMAPRGTGQDALLLAFPDANTTDTVVLALALARVLSEAVWLDHDVLFLLADSPYAVSYFASALRDPALNPDLAPAAKVRNAICLRFPDLARAQQDSIHLAFHGFNGELPNYDLVHGAVVTARAFHMEPVVVSGTGTADGSTTVPLRRGGVFPSWIASLLSLAMQLTASPVALYRAPVFQLPLFWNRVQSFWVQAIRSLTSCGDGPHAILRKENIYALTLAAVPAPQKGNWLNVAIRVGTITESMVRSLNNLHEPLHASSTIYLPMDLTAFASFDVANFVSWSGMAAVILTTINLNRSLSKEPHDMLAAFPLLLLHLVSGLLCYIMPTLCSFLPPSEGLVLSVVAMGLSATLVASPRTVTQAARWVGAGRVLLQRNPPFKRTQCYLQVVITVFASALTVWNPLLCVVVCLYTFALGAVANLRSRLLSLACIGIASPLLWLHWVLRAIERNARSGPTPVLTNLSYISGSVLLLPYWALLLRSRL